MIKAIETVYIAGKMQDDDWRRSLFDETGYTSSHPHKNNPLTYWNLYGYGDIGSDASWPDRSELTVSGLRYTGPFFVDTNGGHGYSYSEEEGHGGNVESLYQTGP